MHTARSRLVEQVICSMQIVVHSRHVRNASYVRHRQIGPACPKSANIGCQLMFRSLGRRILPRQGISASALVTLQSLRLCYISDRKMRQGRKPMKLKSALFGLAALGGLAAAGTAPAMPVAPLSPASNIEKAAAVCGPNGCVQTAPVYPYGYVLNVRPYPYSTRIIHDRRYRSVRTGCLTIGYDPLPYRFGSASVWAPPYRYLCR